MTTSQETPDHPQSSKKAGAEACMKALRAMEKLSRQPGMDQPMSAETYYHERDQMVNALLGAAEPLSPYMQGFLSTIAEYIDLSLSCGQPVSAYWKPEAAKDETELAQSRASSYVAIG